MLKFKKNHYTIEEVTLCGETVRFRAFRDLVYVEKPVNVEFQKMNLFVPESYYEGTSINGYDLLSAPVFMPNTVGGYMPGPADEPGANPFLQGKPNTIFRALQHGYVVASPAIRGRVQKGEDGHYNGKAPACVVDYKAPACVVDYKAAVRYLHFLADELPGDENKIITNGTSAGGALSSLMGSTGNHPDYEPYLQALGAADAGDDVFAASCYCPIINLEHADMAYEWEFCGVNDFHRANMKMDEGGRPVFTPVDGEMTEEQIRVSVEEKALFPAYVKDITRMKTAPAFDALDLESPENDLFGNEMTNCRHFTEYSAANTKVQGERAEKKIVKMLNPMEYVMDEMAQKAHHFRIRHGECDRDTSLVISAMLVLKLREAGCEVDYHSPWNTPHAGDYDLDELFAWIDGICG